MAIDEKAPSEKRPLTFHLGPQIPAGASLVVGGVQAYVSRKATVPPLQVSVTATAESSTLTLSGNPGKGALLIVNPGSPTAEETFKVTSMSGNVATLSHTTEQIISSGTTVNYETGWTDRFLVDDTPAPVGTDVTLWTQYGADGQTFRISVLALLDDGQMVEEERDLKIVEHAAITTKSLQVDTISNVEFGFDGPVALAGQGIASAVAWLSRETSVSAQISTSVAQGASTIQISVNPGVGAMLTLNPAGATHEKLKVSNVTGTGPFTCTVNPTPDFTHEPPESLIFEPGFTTRMLTPPTPSIVGSTKAIVQRRRGAAGQTYRLTVLATLLGPDGERVQGSTHLDIIED